MASITPRQSCIKCNKGLGNTTCAGCQQWLCTRHFIEHRQDLATEIGHVSQKHDVLQRDLTKEHSEHPLVSRINDWEQISIQRIQKAAEDARMNLRKPLDNIKNELKISLDQLTKELQLSRDTDDFTEIELKKWIEQLEELRGQLEKPSTIEIIDDNSTPSMIRLIQIKEHPMTIRPLSHITTVNVTWTQNGVSVAGGHGGGNELNQLHCPYGLYVDEEQTAFIADYGNHRIMGWKHGATSGQVVIDGNGQENQTDQLPSPTDVIVNKETNSLIMSDYGNRRIMRWSRRSGPNGEIIISNIRCYGLALDDQISLYVCDFDKHEVRRYRMGETDGTVVAGGNGRGDGLNQLNTPHNVFVDRDHSVYVSDFNNHRVMKWMKDAKEGVVVAGGQGSGNSLTRLSYPRGLVVDPSGTVYVADQANHRVVRWSNGATQGSVIVGGNGPGAQANQLHNPFGLSFDRQGSLYVVDYGNHRIQRFTIEHN